MVSALDDDIGKILALLKQHGVYDNSVIVFTADVSLQNGAEVANGGNNYPLRGSKYTMWEGATRASAFVHSPLLEEKGYTYDGLIHAVDWYSTFVSLAGGDLSTDWCPTISKVFLMPKINASGIDNDFIESDS